MINHTKFLLYFTHICLSLNFDKTEALKKMKKFLAVFAVLALAASAAYAEVTREQAAEKSKEMVGELGGAVRSKLLETVKNSGFAAAIPVCKEIAPAKAKEVSGKYKASIRRVSLKNRNIGNTPDEYEASMLRNMEQDLAGGKLKEAYAEVVIAAGGKKNLRFMKPVVTEALCLNCHGTPDKLNPEAAKAIKELYPDDKATGYGLNQIRGAVTVIYPMN